MTMGTLVILVLTVLAQAAPDTPAAQDKAKAQRLLSEGATLYEKGEYTSALAKFDAAYAARLTSRSSES
jgi:hypothetical protein